MTLITNQNQYLANSRFFVQHNSCQQEKNSKVKYL